MSPGAARLTAGAHAAYLIASGVWPLLDRSSFEAVTGRSVSDAWMERLQRGGVAVLLVMMTIALFNDVTRLFN